MTNEATIINELLKKLGITMKNSKRESSSIPAFSTIKNYWETRTPGIKHSDSEPDLRISR